MSLKKLAAKGQQLIKDQENANKMVEEAKEAGDEARAKAAKALYDEKVAEFDLLQDQITEAEAHAERMKAIEDLQKLSAKGSGVDPSVVDGGGVAIPSGRITDVSLKSDPVRDEMQNEDIFLRWFCDQKSVSGNEYESIKPKSAEASKSSAAAGGAVLPARARVALCGKNYANTFGLRNKTVYPVPAAETYEGANPSMAQYLTNPQYGTELQMMPLPTTSILDRVSIMDINTDELYLPVLVQEDGDEFGGMQWQFVEKYGTPKPETEPTFDQRHFKTTEISGYTEIHEMLFKRSVIDMNTFIRLMANGGIRYLMENKIFTGDGSGEFLGINQATGVRTVARQSGSHVVYKDYTGMKYALPSYHRNGASWAMHDSVAEETENILDNEGRPLMKDGGNSVIGRQILGHPYSETTNMSSLGYTGDLIFGLWQNYTVVMEQEVVVASSSDFLFRKNKVAVKMVAWADGRPMHARAFVRLVGQAS